MTLLDQTGRGAPQLLSTRLASPLDADRDWRAGNIGRLLFSATRLFVRDKLAVVREAGAAGVSEAMMALLLNLDREGTRLTDLALRAGQTKQSMIELIDKAEAIGLVDRRPDPGDLRAKFVRFTGEGAALLGSVERGIVVAERRFAAITGQRFTDDLKHALARYIDEPMVDGPSAWRRRNAGRLLALSARRFACAVADDVGEQGHGEVSENLLALFRELDLGGTRLTTLAARAGVTKPSMRELVDRAARLGFVERRPDPADGRAKIVAFTPAGLRLLGGMRRGVALAEAAFARMAGEPFTRAIKTALAAYLAVSEAPDR